MTVFNDVYANTYIGNGSTIDYVFTFQATREAWVTATVNGVAKPGTVTLNSDQENNNGGVFTFDVAPENNSVVTLTRIIPRDQQLDLPDYTPFPARNMEDALDKITMILASLLDVNQDADINADLTFLERLIIGDSGSIFFANQEGSVDPADDNVYKLETAFGALSLQVSDGQGNFDELISITDESIQLLQRTQITAFPQGPADITNRDYVDQGLADKVSVFGDTMRGALNVPDQPATGRAAVNKTYVEEVITSIFDGLQFKGFYDASSGDLPTDTTNGDFYVIAVGGTLNVSDGLNPPTPEPVEQGDKIVYSENIIAWVAIRAGSGGNATQIGFTPTGNYTAANVQAALEEADDSLFAHAGGDIDEELSGAKTFQGKANFKDIVELIPATNDNPDENGNWRYSVDSNEHFLIEQKTSIGTWEKRLEHDGISVEFFNGSSNLLAKIQTTTNATTNTLLTRTYGDKAYAQWYATEAEAQADTSGRIVYADAGS